MGNVIFQALAQFFQIPLHQCTTKSIRYEKFLIPALFLGFALTANAQEATTTTKTVEKTVVKDQKDYKEIDPVSVNNDALKTVLTKYKGHQIQEAFRAEDGDYKLVLSKDKKNKTVYIAKTGKVIKEA